MSLAPAPTSAGLKRTEIVPLLQNGDRLSSVEFERRYARMPNVKAELIEGVVYMSSPVRVENHGKPHILLSTWLGTYYAKTPGLVTPADNVTVRLDDDNTVQPDLILLLPAHVGGTSKIDEDDYVAGGPEFVAEIAASSVSIDTHTKQNSYRRNRVREYLVWRVEQTAIDWLFLNNSEYERLPDENGVIRSRVFPGLWLDTAAMLKQDLAAALTTLEHGLASREHAEFVRNLALNAKS